MNKLKFTVLIIGSFALGLLMYPIIQMAFQTQEVGWLPYNHVRGMAISHDHQLYTLNFEQQNKIIKLLNDAETIEASPKFQKKNFEYSKLYVYRFNNTTLELIPIQIENGLLVFKINGWDKKLMKETGKGEMHHLLSQTF